MLLHVSTLLLHLCCTVVSIAKPLARLPDISKKPQGVRLLLKWLSIKLKTWVWRGSPLQLPVYRTTPYEKYLQLVRWRQPEPSVWYSPSWLGGSLRPIHQYYSATEVCPNYYREVFVSLLLFLCYPYWFFRVAGFWYFWYSCLGSFDPHTSFPINILCSCICPCPVFALLSFLFCCLFPFPSLFSSTCICIARVVASIMG